MLAVSQWWPAEGDWSMAAAVGGGGRKGTVAQCSQQAAAREQQCAPSSEAFRSLVVRAARVGAWCGLAAVQRNGRAWAEQQCSKQQAGSGRRLAGMGVDYEMGLGERGIHTLTQPSRVLGVQFLSMQGRTDAITGNWLFHAAPVDSRRILAALRKATI